ncbi:MAG TPA: DUF5678 domain-containing protein [Chloroflexota bacterium]|nr:DUF5678 domain-containing protein [Chloroflexota bacterium]
MTAPIDDMEAAQAAYDRAVEGTEFWIEHFDELVARYPDEYVAVSVYDREVVDHDPDPDALLDRLHARGLSHLDVWVDFTFTKFPNYAL